jgi:predicted acylesterase/phospholipase RssA
VLKYVTGIKLPTRYVIVRVFLEGTTIFILLFVGILVSYNLAAALHRGLRRRPRVVVHDPAPASPGGGNRLDRFEKIGIILSGGGAKGAYQAGAMKAIHEFLERNNALDRVRMIAGTSIGSWNAMFWLAGLVKPPAPGTPSAHEAWWRSIRVGRIAEFARYLPFRQNYFLRATPWQETFRDLFVAPQAVRDRLAGLFAAQGGPQDPPLHFYLTRSNVEGGYLEFATNWPGIHDLKRPDLRTENPDDEEPVVSSGRYEIIEGGDVHACLDRTCRAVFASMDIPPLFPYVRIRLDREEVFEDGGVVDNLPVWFGTHVEGCDLLFVLPLNASFAEPVNQTSVAARLFRVMDVRQGVLERNSLKLAYLYNELAAAQVGQEDAARALKMRKLRRKHRPVSVFAICPAHPLAIGTAEFWKAKEAGRAFDLMYSATKYELEEKFEEATNPGWIRMALVSPFGERTYADDF